MQSEKRLYIDKKCLAPLGECGVKPIFDRQRQFTQEVSERFNMLCRQAIDSEIIHSGCELLAKKGLLVLANDEENMVVSVEGRSVPLYRVDIDKIARLPRSDFADLQMHHALIMSAYQSSSLYHLDAVEHKNIYKSSSVVYG